MNFEIKRISAEEVWPIRHKVMYPNETFEYVKLPKDDIGEHYGLFDKDGLATIVSLFIENGKIQFRKLATLKIKQKRGYGSQLLNYVFEKANRMDMEVIWCNSRVNKTSFYTRYGMRKTKQTYTKLGINFVVMEKRLRSRDDIKNNITDKK